MRPHTGPQARHSVEPSYHTSIYIPERILDALAALAKVREVTRNEIIREALQQYIERVANG